MNRMDSRCLRRWPLKKKYHFCLTCEVLIHWSYSGVEVRFIEPVREEPGRINPTPTSTGETPVLRFYIDTGIISNYLATIIPPFCLNHFLLNDKLSIRP